MKVVIPVAGLGSRLKPHTFVTSKALLPIAGKEVLSYVLDDVASLQPEEVIVIVGYHKEKIIEFVQKNYPSLPCTFKEQEVLDGDGGALRVALEGTTDDELYVIFGADTLIDFSLKKELQALRKASVDAGVFTMQVADPSHYGVVNVDADGFVYELEEKPALPKSNLAIIGAYYFSSSDRIKTILNTFYEREESLNGEYKIAQVLDYLTQTDKVKAVEVSQWFDCGRVEVLLDANAYFLEKKSKHKVVKRGSSLIIPPCYVPQSVKLERSIVGPHVSLGEDVSLTDVHISRSIIGVGSTLESVQVKDSVCGKDVTLISAPRQVSLTDKSSLVSKR